MPRGVYQRRRYTIVESDTDVQWPERVDEDYALDYEDLWYQGSRIRLEAA